MPFLTRVLANACPCALPKVRGPGGTNHAGRSGASLDAAVGAALRPAIGDRATGYGARGTVIAVPDCQPLAADGIWRVTLAGEEFGRLVRRGGREHDGETWQLLQLDDVSDEQLDTYEASMHDQGQSGTVSPL